MAEQTDRPLRPGDHVEITGGIHEGHTGTLIAEPTAMYSDEGEMRALVSVPIPGLTTVSPLVSQLRQVPPPVAGSEIPQDVLDAAENAAKAAWYDGQQPAREQMRAALTAALPHLTAERDTEITRLRAELADYSEQYGDQREALNRERARMTAVADALTFGATDLVGAITGEEIKDRAGQIVRALVADNVQLQRLLDERSRVPAVLRETPAPSAPEGGNTP